MTGSSIDPVKPPVVMFFQEPSGFWGGCAINLSPPRDQVLQNQMSWMYSTSQKVSDNVNNASVPRQQPTLLNNYLTMLRSPLQSINPNIRKGKELSPSQRGIIWGKYSAGVSKSAISRELQIPRTTVYDTIVKYPQRNETHSISRPGRPKKVTERDERHILIIIKGDPFLT
ncbi:hypothetical protein, partial [Stenotrophomonas sp. MA5]|uniref:hypothetical protein n=1 Tax=Stenotrophomonas sp. MA5 TaxID=2508572 RepID=UPI0019D6DDF7